MKRLRLPGRAVFCGMVIGMLASGCGGDATVEGAGGGGSATCPNDPSDDHVVALVGKPCFTAAWPLLSPPDTVCASNNGCGGCSVSCINGMWVSSDANLCYSLGAGC